MIGRTWHLDTFDGEALRLTVAPSESAEAPDENHTVPATAQFVARMRSLTAQHGTDADAFAARVFAALREQRFWIVPQPEALDDALRAKTDGILARRDPRLVQW